MNDFAAYLRHWASTHDFGHLFQDALRGRFVSGRSNTKKLLLSEKGLTFAKAIGIAQAMKEATTHSAALHHQAFWSLQIS